MPRSILLALAVMAAAHGAAAQESDSAVVDFVLRPTDDPDSRVDDDIWAWDSAQEDSIPEDELGPPLAGPTTEDPIGPPPAGPLPSEPQRAERRVRGEETDPFAAIGMRIGAFVIRPAIEIGVEATDNVAGTEDKVGAVGLAVAPEINVRGATDRYEIEIDLRGEAISYDREEFNAQTADARARARYEVTSRTALIGEAGYSRTLDDFTDPDTPGGAAERPAVDTFDASLGIEQRFGRVKAELSGFAERAVHEEVLLSGGGLASREELDNTEYGGRLRTAYASGRSLSPFVEVAGGRRDYDRNVDDSGFERESIWGELRGGLIIDRGAKVSGEVSLGYRREDIEDSRLKDLDILLADASILWSPRRLTEVRFDFSTDTMSTSEPGVSASVLYAGRLTLARSLTPRIRAETGAGLEFERSVGDDDRDVTFIGFAGASYAFNRTASLEGRYIYERTESNQPGDDSEAHIVSVRLRLQR